MREESAVVDVYITGLCYIYTTVTTFNSVTACEVLDLQQWIHQRIHPVQVPLLQRQNL